METMREVLHVVWEGIKSFWEELFFLTLTNLVTIVPILLSLAILYGASAVWSIGNETLAIVLLALLVVPVILFPPALGGLWNVANRVTDEYAPHWSDYFEGFRRYFWKSLALAVLNVVVLGVMALGIQFYAPASNPLKIDPTVSTMLQMFVLFLAIAWAIYQIYPMAMLLEQTDQRLRVALRNAAVLYVKRPGFAVLLALLLLIVIVLSTLLQLPWILITWSLIAVICNKAVKHLLIPYREQLRAEAESEERQKEIRAEEELPNEKSSH